MNYIKITKENIDKEHICCAMSNKQCVAKKEWLKDRFDEGLVFYRSVERGKCFNEYIPAENDSLIYPHLLRHTFATTYLENGGNIYALQQILGHTTLDMVKKYVHLTQAKTVVNFDKYSPLDNLN